MKPGALLSKVRPAAGALGSKPSFVLDERGGAASLTGVMMVFIFAMLFAAAGEYMNLHNAALRAQNALDASVSAALAATDVMHMQVLAEEAEAAFLARLAENLRLDPDLMPQPGSIACGRVEYFFAAYNAGDAGTVTPGGHIVERPGVYAEVYVPVRPIVRGVLGDSIVVARRRFADILLVRRDDH